MSQSRLLVILSVLLFACAMVGATASSEVLEASPSLFDSWASTHGLSFASPQERAHRYENFVKSVEEINVLNAQHKGKAAFDLNQFSALAPDEFAQLTGARNDAFYDAQSEALRRYFEEDPRRTLPLVKEEALAAIPSSFDWRNHTPSIITPVKNQHLCGDCWAFSTTGNIEAQWVLAGHPLVSLSDQNLCDCTTNNRGCGGGMVGNALNYVIKNGGIDTESSYPYEAKQGACRFKRASVGANVTGFLRVPHNASSLMFYLVNKGPISVGVDADTWKHYKGGTVIPAKGCGTRLTHWVLLVGYGSSPSLGPFWLLKNSWGAKWGMKGYIMIERSNTVDSCGIFDHPLISTVK